MSLVHLGIHGADDFKAGKNSWSHADYDLLHSPAGVKKIHRAFEKTPFKFNVNLYIGKENALADKVKKFIPSKELVQLDCINVCHTTNVTGMHAMPMNAWTIVHRMAHGLQADNMVPQDNLMSMLAESYKNITGFVPNGSGHRFEGFGTDIDGMLLLLLTMRSARIGWLNAGLDPLGELLAQYVISGKITLLRTPGWDQRIDVLHAKTLDPKIPFYFHDIYKKVDYFFTKAYEHCGGEMGIAEQLSKLEAGLNREIHAMLEQAVGKLIAF